MRETVPLSPPVKALIVLLSMAVAAAVVFVSVHFVNEGQHHYPETAEKGFLSGCSQSGYPAPTCACILAALEKRYTFDEFGRIEDRFARTGSLPSDALAAVSSCAAPSSQPSA